MKAVRGLLTIAAMLASGHAIGQTNLNFNAVAATIEGAIRLSWNSTSNEYYRIDYATELVDVSAGVTDWQTLYDDYPSHGTNTFIADAGNYDFSPEIAHPKLFPTRFYRISLLGTSTSPTNPTVAIAFPTNGASLSGGVTVTVSSASMEVLAEVKLYVDGEEQWIGGDGTNFFINTCEWPNGPHVIYATAKSQSSIEGFPYNNDITYGRSVSSYVNVTFDNLIVRFDFSEPFFEPSEGQTQRVSALFAVGVDWSLAIQDASSNTLRFASGSGGSMTFDWDGTGTNGASLPDGVYSYLLTAQTNGQSYSGGSTNGSGGDTNAPPSPGSSFAESKSEDWYPTSVTEALMAGLTSYYVQLPLPPVFTNGVWVSWKERPPVEVQIPLSLQDKFLESLASGNGFSLMDGGESNGAENYSGAASQSTRGPKRKPRVGVKNKSGTFGICYKTYPFGTFSQQPRTGRIPPLQPVFTGIDGGSPGTGYIPWATLKSDKFVAQGFSQVMQAGAFKPKFVKADEQWGPQDIKKPALARR